MAEPTPELRSFFTATPFFGGLDERALDHVIQMLVTRKLHVGETVYREGEAGRSMFVLASGEIVMCKSGGHGHMVRMVRMRPGDFFGETTLIEMQPRPYTACVETAGVAYELAAKDLYQLYRQEVHAYVLVLQNINREICRRLRKADARIIEIADATGDDVTQIRTAVLP